MGALREYNESNSDGRLDYVNGPLAQCTVLLRPTRIVIVIKGSAGRIFDQMSSVIGGSAARLDLMSSILGGHSG